MNCPNRLSHSGGVAPVRTSHPFVSLFSLVGSMLLASSAFASTTGPEQIPVRPQQKPAASSKTVIAKTVTKTPTGATVTCTVVVPSEPPTRPVPGKPYIPPVEPPPPCLSPEQRASWEKTNQALQALHDLYSKQSAVTAQAKGKPQFKLSNAPPQAQSPKTIAVQDTGNETAMAANKAGMARPADPSSGLPPNAQGALRVANGGTSALPPEVQAAYDAANQMVQFNSATPNVTHDANGNLTSLTDANGTTTFTWDARNRLIARNGPGINESFAYDALNRRVSKTSNGETTQYLYDGNDIVAEIKGGVVVATHLRNPAVPDDPFIRQSTVGNEHYHRDAQGSTLGLTDNTGAVRTRYSYDAFGNTTMTGVPSTNPFQYTGRENDGNGLYYLRARYYSPQFQRFLSEDPIRFYGGDINLYAYALNSPATFNDPSGLCPPCLAGIPAAAPAIGAAAGDAAIIVGGIIAGAAIGDIILDNAIQRKKVDKGDDPGFQSEEGRRKAIKEAQEKLKDPNASQTEKSDARKRIKQLSQRPSKKAHGADTQRGIIIGGTGSSVNGPDGFGAPPLGCRKDCN